MIVDRADLTGSKSVASDLPSHAQPVSSSFRSVGVDASTDTARCLDEAVPSVGHLPPSTVLQASAFLTAKPCRRSVDQTTPSRRLNSQQACVHLGVSARVLAELRTKRLIAYYKIGHKTVSYDRQDLDRFLASRRIPAICEPGRPWTRSSSNAAV